VPEGFAPLEVPEGAPVEVLGAEAPKGFTPPAALEEISLVAVLEGFTLIEVLEGLALVEVPVIVEAGVMSESIPQLWCSMGKLFFGAKEEHSRPRGNGEKSLVIRGGPDKGEV
jgi:hypothetical protein